MRGQNSVASRLRDKLNAKRRELPWVKIEKDYVFDTVEGKRTLADLFEGRSQLIVQHFMFGPRSRGRRSRSSRPTASAWAGHFKFASSLNIDFNCDFNVSFRKEDLEKGRVYYNFEMIDAEDANDELPGRSVLCKDENGDIYHTYSL